MSQSVIQCRECHHTLAKRHHTGRIKVCAGIHVVVLPDGHVQLECPCGHKRVLIVGKDERKAA